MKRSEGKILETKEEKKRQYLSQADVPSYGLEEVLRVPKAIVENYASKPVTPVQLAKAMQMAPTSGPFKMLCGAAIAYGLTTGGYNAKEIKLEPLASRILRPLEEDDDLVAKREAFMKPRVIGEFLRKYDGSPIPRVDIANNVLNDLGVPENRLEEVFSLIVQTGEILGLISDIKGKKYVDLKGAGVQKDAIQVDEQTITKDEIPEDETKKSRAPQVLHTVKSNIEELKRKRVFITHGKDKSFVEPIKKLLQFGELEAVVSVERQSVSQPVPDKFMSDMRSCGAAIIHVDAEQKLLDPNGKEHLVLNPNVLIEIGAALALYGRRFILFVRSGITLPSNLQGLYEVRYDGSSLNGDATIRLLEAINEMKKQALPVPQETVT